MLADFDGAVASKGIPAAWCPVIGIGWVVMTVLIVVLPDIIRWWLRSRTAFRLRWHVTYRIGTVVSLFRHRKRPPKTTAGSGAPTLPPPCSTSEDGQLPRPESHRQATTS